MHNQVVAEQTPSADFVAELQSGRIARVPGSAVFLTRAKEDTPPVMSWHVRKNRSLHEYVLALTLTVVSTPRVEPEERVTVTREADKYWRAEARYGFMEQPDIPAVIGRMQGQRAPRSIFPTSPTTSATKPSCRARTARACRAGRKGCSP